VLLLARRASDVATLERRARFSEQAYLLAVSAVEEARVRVAAGANLPGSPCYGPLRAALDRPAAFTVAPEATAALAAAASSAVATELESVVVTVVGRQSTCATTGGAGPDWPYGRGWAGKLRFEASARVDRAWRRVVCQFDARLSSVRAPVPWDRVRLWFGKLGGMSAEQLAGVLGRLTVDAGTGGPLDEKLTTFCLEEEAAMAASFKEVLPPGGRPAWPVSSASYLFLSAREALQALYPLEDDPGALVLPEGIVLCAEALELPPSRYRGGGVLVCNGDLTLHGVVRDAGARPDDSLVLATIGRGRRLRFDGAPVEAALVALGEDSRVEPDGATTSLLLHGALASAVPSGLLTGTLVYDPALFAGRTDGPYRAPPAPGAPPAAALAPGDGGDLDLGAYRFSMARYAGNAAEAAAEK
jgi:hypothetical protein